MPMPRFSSVSWAPTIAMSWLWGLGFVYSMHVVLAYGWAAFAAFAATNATGLFLFGAACGRPGIDPGRIFRVAQDRYGVTLIAYQVVAVGITLYGLGRYVLVPMYGREAAGAAGLLLLISCAVGHAFGLKGLKRIHALTLPPALVAAGVALATLPGVEAPSVSTALDERFLGLLVPSLVGFLLGPWLDVQQWQRAAAIRASGASPARAYGAGALLFLSLLCLNALLAVSAGPAATSTAADGLAFAGGSVASVLGSIDGGRGAASAAFLIWSILALASTLDSFYVAVRTTLREAMGRSTSTLLALVPTGYATSPLWVAALACGLAWSALRLDVPFLLLMMPFATFFVAAAANLVAETFGAPSTYDAPLSLMLGLCAMVLFTAGHVANEPAMLALSTFVPLLGAARAMGSLARRTDAAPAAPSTTVAERPSNPVAPASTIAPVGGGHVGHGFDGSWFVMRMTTTYDDTNSVGNVYFANYFRFVGKARELFFNICMPEFDLATTRYLALTKNFEHDFRGEAKEFTPIEVRIRVKQYNRKFVTLEHEIRSETLGLLGRGKQVLMFVDAKDYRLLDLPAEIVRGFGPYLPKSAVPSSERNPPVAQAA